MIHNRVRRAKRHTETTWQWARNHATALFFILASGFVLLLALVFIWIATMKVPAITSFVDRKVSSSTKIYDRTGTVVLYDVHANIKRTVVNQEQISDYARNAIISIEDKDFYSHHGIKPTSIIRAGLS
ncbi:hypothetical protein EBR96_10335, partial [bacterium]|nr:hypothetical protein [bacterium]